MSLDQVAQLAHQAASEESVLQALRNDPAQISTPLNLSDAHLRALISAGSFTTARPAFTTSTPQQSLAHQIAAMDVGTLFPPEGQGQFPTPGELPPVVVAPHSAPTAAPVAGTAPRPISPQPKAPVSTPAAPVASGSPQPRSTPKATPISGQPQSPQPQRPPTTTPTSGQPQSPQAPISTSGPAPTVSGTSQGTPAGGSGQTPGQAAQSSGADQIPEQVAEQSPSPCFQQTFEGTSCCPCLVAMVSIVAELSTVTQTALTAITALAGTC
jgi:hypothetical protein